MTILNSPEGNRNPIENWDDSYPLEIALNALHNDLRGDYVNNREQLKAALDLYDQTGDATSLVAYLDDQIENAAAKGHSDGYLRDLKRIRNSFD